MSRDINTVAVSGRLTKDPELRQTASGTSVLNFSVACNDRRKNPQSGEWENVPSYFDCVLFGNSADWMSRDLHKGKYVHVQGRLRQSRWEAKDGTSRSKVEIVADDVCYERPPRDSQQFSAPQQANSGNYASGYQSAPQTPPQPTREAYVDHRPMQQQPELVPYDQDIPFGG